MSVDLEQLSAEEKALYWAYHHLPYFAEHCLKIKGKEPGELLPFVFNKPQLKLHFALERQLKEKGMVRAAVPKSRRVGVSTYVASRFYQKTSMNRGRNSFILSHKQDTTDTLFGIVDRFQSNNPIAPHIGRSNVKQLIFDLLDSGYDVATAGSRDAGRGQLAHYLHMSELAYFEEAERIMASTMQIVSDSPGTEVIIESTGAGPEGVFYDVVQDAIAGRGDYIYVFLPWHEDPDNVRSVPEGFEIDGPGAFQDGMSEQEAMELYDLSLAQLAWRRAKLFDIKSHERFQLEYPATLSDVWASAKVQGLIRVEHVMRARRAQKNPNGSRIMGVDCASTGGDRFSIALREGMVVRWVKSRTNVSFHEGLAWVRAMIDEFKPDTCNIDAAGGGNGDAICQSLRQNPEYVHIVKPVLFGSTSQAKLARPDKAGPINRRAEMYGRVRDALEAGELQLPQSDSVQADLTSPEQEWINSNGDWKLKSKHKMKVSPDEGDAVALTFADSYARPLHPPREGAIHSPLNTSKQTCFTPRRPPSGCSWMA